MRASRDGGAADDDGDDALVHRAVRPRNPAASSAARPMARPIRKRRKWSERITIMDAELSAKFEQAVRSDGRYALEAFEFLHRGLELATQCKHGEDDSRSRHVSGQELCHALQALALQMWGPLAPTVLGTWNIHQTRDFGEMVYLMIRLGLMGRQDSDDITDFDDVYDFHSAFGRYEIPLDATSAEEPTS
jgi:uncharacterized repeat protein (TIGR04138 family)